MFFGEPGKPKIHILDTSSEGPVLSGLFHTLSICFGGYFVYIKITPTENQGELVQPRKYILLDLRLEQNGALCGKKISLWSACMLPGEKDENVLELIPEHIPKELIVTTLTEDGFAIVACWQTIEEELKSSIPTIPMPNANPSRTPLELHPEFDGKTTKYFRDIGKKWPPQIVLNLSGGKDSIAKGLKFCEEGIPIHGAIFFDTGWEFPEIYETIEKFEKYTGVKIVRLKPKRGFDELIKKYRWPGQGYL